MSRKYTSVLVRVNNSVELVNHDPSFYINSNSDNHSTFRVRDVNVKHLLLEYNGFNDQFDGEFDSDNLWPSNFIASMICGIEIYGNAVFYLRNGSFTIEMLKTVLEHKGFPNTPLSGCGIRFPENKRQFSK